MLQRLIARLLPKQRRLEIVRKSSNTLTIDQWRGEKELVSAAIRLWTNPDFQMMMDALKNSHPCWGVLPPLVGTEVRAARQGIIEGYTMAIANIEQMKVYRRPVELQAPTYEPAEETT